MFHRILPLFVALPFLIFSCTNQEAADAEKQRQDSILRAQEDSLLNLFKGELQAISGMINQVNASQGIITLDTSEGNELNKETIIAQVEALSNVLNANQNQLRDLSKRMKASNVKNAELETMIKTMEERIAQRETQIAELMKMLADKDVQIQEIIATVDSMRQSTIALTDRIVNMDESMHEVYYVIGEAKELKEKGIITKDGGLLGLGASKKMDVTQLDQSHFKKVDKRDLENLAIFSKKAKLITSHPEGSYEFRMDSDGQVESLEINDKDRFWMAGDYLVVEVTN